MIKIENFEVYGWEAAIRGMRNPLNSWDKSDSFKTVIEEVEDGDDISSVYHCSGIGPDDRELMKTLVKAGSDHSKFMRMINVTCDITAPLYWWKEFDTYKVGTVRNSCSTMHKLPEKEFTLDDFSMKELLENVEESWVQELINMLNVLRDVYNNFDEMKANDMLREEADKKKLWYGMVQLLPSSYNQKATIQLNYQVLRNMYHSRKNHKLDEWQEFCEWIKTLPYSELITEEF